ncbi:cystathionine beta-lyase [Bosea sp. BIWAKO-01]|uniref:cystathionine beta-lyase n=1 Tax=Bosea sp. BIWAKO-01 TaxID=506668 RepID=UPI0008529A3C|nr:cystathionine beta-lyase [Bosea sp. BIWAKO-01]
MTDEHPARHWRTRLVHPRVAASQDFRALVPAIHRGSTVLFERVAEARDDWRGEGYSYGLYGTPTTRELALRIADLEGARASFVVPGGQAAIALIYLAFCRAGDHALLPETAYGPNRELADELLAGLGVTVETYDPLIGSGIAALIRPNTRLIWCESPGTITMEVQDVPAIVAAAHAAGVPVALDNTYAAGVLFDAFAHGVDVSMQALTKYVGGHSDILLGTVSAGTEEARERIGATHRLLGMAVSPDDCALALRGLETLAVRLDRLERTTLEIAHWLKARPEVALVLHPALPDCPGHEIWRRDFTGSASVFSVVFEPGWDTQRITGFVEALRLFRLGFSWGGTHSLAMAYPPLPRTQRGYDGRIVRLNVGLEEPADLFADLEQALNQAA